MQTRLEQVLISGLRLGSFVASANNSFHSVEFSPKDPSMCTSFLFITFIKYSFLHLFPSKHLAAKFPTISSCSLALFKAACSIKSLQVSRWSGIFLVILLTKSTNKMVSVSFVKTSRSCKSILTL